MIGHVLGKKGVAILMEKVRNDLHAVVDLERELVILREKLTDVLSDILEGEVAHQVFFLQQLLDRYTVFIFCIGDIRHQHKGILFIQLAV